ncbi:hypothetical protein MMPV_003197 [Pyropia vietnamensis]
MLHRSRCIGVAITVPPPAGGPQQPDGRWGGGGGGGVALQYARYVGRGELNQDIEEEPACNGTDFTVRLQTAEGAGVQPTGAGSAIPPGTDATEASAVGSIVVAGPGGVSPAGATVTPVAPVQTPATTTPAPVATAQPIATAGPTPTPVEPPIVAPVPVPGDETDGGSPDDVEEESDEPTVEPTEEPVVAGAAGVEAAPGETDDDGGSNLVPILVGLALGAAALGLAAFAILMRIRTVEASGAGGAAVTRAPPLSSPAPGAPPAPAVVVPAEPVAPLPVVPVAETAGLAATGVAAGGAAVAAAPVVVAPVTNTHDYQIGEGPVVASSPPPPPGFLIPAETTAIGGLGDGAADAGIRGVDGMAVEGATVPVATTATVVDGVEGAAPSVLPVVGAVGAMGAAATAAPFVVPPARKESGSSASSLDGGPPAPPVMSDKERSYYTNVRSGSDAPLPPPPPPAVPVAPTLGTTDYGVPPEAPDFPAADAYGAGVEEPASFGGKMMSGLTGGLAGTGRDATGGAYEVGTGGEASLTEDARDMGMPVLDSPEK